MCVIFDISYFIILCYIYLHKNITTDEKALKRKNTALHGKLNMRPKQKLARFGANVLIFFLSKYLVIINYY